MEEELIKGGEAIVRINIRRSKNGHSLYIWAHKTIEEYFASISDGKYAASEFGRNWIKRPGSGALEVHMGKTVDMIESPGGAIDLNRVGQPLFISAREAGTREDVINISFLRLVGISEGDGRAFDFKFVGTDEALTGLAKKLRDAVKTFYVSFLKPVDVTVSVIAQRNL